jgi:RHS repeat-associated protein
MLHIIKSLKTFFDRTRASAPKKRRYVPLQLESLESRDLLSSLLASAAVNLIDGPNTVISTNGSPVTSSASGRGSASASASDFQLNATASGADGLTFNASGSAQGVWDFQILGVPQGTQVPLDFTYQTGLTTDTATPTSTSFPPPRISASTLVSYDVSSGLVEQKGLEQFASQDGTIVVDNIVGDTGSNHVLSATFTGSGSLIAEVQAFGTQDPQAISSFAMATFELQDVSSPLASQYPDLALQFDDGQTIHLGTGAAHLKDDGSAGDTPGNIQLGEPIDINTGNVYQSVADYSTAGSDALSFTRYYNTFALPNDAATALGERWRSNYDSYLYMNSPTSITAERATGQVLSFTLANGVWISDSDVDYTLTQSGSNWKLTDPQNSVETYTVNASGLGLLDTIQARDGYTQTLQYNGSGQLATVTDSFGRELSFTYQNGLLSTLTTPNGLVVSYGYGSGAGGLEELTSVTYSTTPQTSLSYDYYSTGLLKDIFDQDGNRYVSYVYDSQNRATQVYMGGNTGIDSVAVSYNDADGSRTVTDANGLRTVYKFAVLQGVPKVTEIERLPSTGAPTTSSYTYDANGYVASYTDWNGDVTQYVNDARGLPISITAAAGTPLATTTTISYLPNFNLPVQIVAPGLTTNYTYDANGNVLTCVETDTTTQTVPYSTNGQQRIWTYTYDLLGHVLTATGPRTDVKDTTTYTYDADGNLSTVTDALGHVTRITSYNQSGLPLSMTDANGVVTMLAYDAMGRLLTSTVVTAAGNAVTRYGYDAAGLLTSVTQPDNSVLYYTYDAAERLIGVSDPAGESITYTLDGMGNIVQQDIKNSSGAIVETQSQVFSQLNELVQSVGALPTEVTSYAYDPDGNVTSITDAKNNTTFQAFDALNRLISVTDPLNGVTQYGYNAQGENASVTTPRDLATSYVYNGFGQVIQAASPDTGTTVYHLDAAGNVISQTDARGVVTKWTYDALNRVTSETFPASPAQNITYTYDSTKGGNKGIGRLTGFTDESGRTRLKYDAVGDVIAVIQVTGGQRYKTTYAYNLAGNVTRITYPSGLIINYTYDSQGRISGVTSQADGKAKPVTLASNVTYEPFGPLASLTYGNGLVMTRTYNADYQITGITTKSATTTVQSLSLGYDVNGNVASIIDNLTPGESQTFTYDALNRLTTATGPYPTITYTYDADSNRLTSTQGGVTQTYHYSPTSDQLLSVSSSNGSTEKFTYTANGNIATDIGAGKDAIYTYSNGNRLAQATTGGDKASYLYNALGERMSETVGKTVTDFLYNQNGNLIAEANGENGNATTEYVWLGDLPLAQIENGKIYYIQSDQTNTPQLMTDASRKIVWDRQQEPFGQTVSTTGRATNSLRFPGQIADAATGLNYNMMRDYDPALGRYIEADPIGLAGGTNLYGYVGQNPVTRSDPLGLCSSATPGSPPNDNPFSFWENLVGSLDNALSFLGLKTPELTALDAVLTLKSDLYENSNLQRSVAELGGQTAFGLGGAALAGEAGAVAGADAGFLIGEAIFPFGGGFPGALIGGISLGLVGAIGGGLEGGDLGKSLGATVYDTIASSFPAQIDQSAASGPPGPGYIPVGDGLYFFDDLNFMEGF